MAMGVAELSAGAAALADREDTHAQHDCAAQIGGAELAGGVFAHRQLCRHGVYHSGARLPLTACCMYIPAAKPATYRCTGRQADTTFSPHSALQFVREFTKLGLTRSIGGVLSLAMARELTPVITAIIVAGRVGSAFAAELGTMQVGRVGRDWRASSSAWLGYMMHSHLH